MAKAGRPKGDRQTTKSTFLRLTDDELAQIQAAIDRQTKGVLGRDKVTVASFARDAAILVASRIISGKDP
jgi:hypothetical protein